MIKKKDFNKLNCDNNNLIIKNFININEQQYYNKVLVKKYNIMNNECILPVFLIKVFCDLLQTEYAMISGDS